VRRGKRFRDYAHLGHDQRSAEERRILERWRNDAAEQEQLKKAVRTVLEHVFERQEEVPLIAMYRYGACRKRYYRRAVFWFMLVVVWSLAPFWTQ
jgi:hypothetical protein